MRSMRLTDACFQPDLWPFLLQQVFETQSDRFRSIPRRLTFGTEIYITKPFSKVLIFVCWPYINDLSHGQAFLFRVIRSPSRAGDPMGRPCGDILMTPRRSKMRDEILIDENFCLGYDEVVFPPREGKFSPSRRVARRICWSNRFEGINSISG